MHNIDYFILAHKKKAYFILKIAKIFHHIYEFFLFNVHSTFKKLISKPNQIFTLISDEEKANIFFNCLKCMLRNFSSVHPFFLNY